MKFNKIIKVLLTLVIGVSSIAVGRGGGGHGGGGHGFGRGGGFSRGAGYGGYRGTTAYRSSSFNRPTSSYSNVSQMGYASNARTTGNYSKMSSGKSAVSGRTANRAATSRTATGGAATGKQAGLNKGTGAAATTHANAMNKSGLTKQNANKSNLAKGQQAAKNKIANNSKLAGMNKQNAKNLVNQHGWSHWHNGAFGWNSLWWGLGFGLLPFAWAWGWNWWWGNGIWWWGGYPWYWWQDYDPEYFENTVYPQYVAQYEGVSGDKVSNYWDITNATDNTITVSADQGDKADIPAGQTKRVFHAPDDNKFTADTDSGVQNFDTPTKQVTVKAAEAA